MAGEPIRPLRAGALYRTGAVGLHRSGSAIRSTVDHTFLFVSTVKSFHKTETHNSASPRSVYKAAPGPCFFTYLAGVNL